MQDETELVGRWLLRDGKVVADETEKKIWDLVENRLDRVGERGDGWIVLYRDPGDKSYWELSFPQSEMQGGGPARLSKVSTEEMETLYGADAIGD